MFGIQFDLRRPRNKGGRARKSARLAVECLEDRTSLSTGLDGSLRLAEGDRGTDAVTVTHATAAADTAQRVDIEAALDISAASLTINPGSGGQLRNSRLDAPVTVSGATPFFNSGVGGSGALRNFAAFNLGSTNAESFAGNVKVAVDNEAGVLTAFGVINNDAVRPFVNGLNATLRAAPGMGAGSVGLADGFTNQGRIGVSESLVVANGILTNAPGAAIEFGDSILGSLFEQGGTATGPGTLSVRTKTADFPPNAVNTVANLEVPESSPTSSMTPTNLVSIGGSTINAAAINQGTLTIRRASISTGTINGALTNVAGATPAAVSAGGVQGNPTAAQGLTNNGSIPLAGGDFLEPGNASPTVTGRGDFTNAGTIVLGSFASFLVMQTAGLTGVSDSIAGGLVDFEGGVPDDDGSQAVDGDGAGVRKRRRRVGQVHRYVLHGR
jgi:hypothetical protein